MATALEEHDSYSIGSDEGEGFTYWVVSGRGARCVFRDQEVNRWTAAGATSRDAGYVQLREEVEGGRLSIAKEPLGDGVLIGCQWSIYCAG